MDKPAIHYLERCSITDQQIEMSARTGICGTDRATLVRCEILLLPRGMPAGRSGERFDFSFSRLEQCTIRARGTVKSVHFNVRLQLVDCRFEGGPFESPQFGQSLPPSAPLDGWPDSIVQNCDFRNAELRDARFYSVTIDQVQLPGWPHITLLSPFGAGESQPEPRMMVNPNATNDPLHSPWMFIQDALERPRPAGTSIWVVHASELVKDRELQTSLREMLDNLRHPRIRY